VVGAIIGGVAFPAVHARFVMPTVHRSDVL
jgi:hypothetical protein